MSSDFRYYMIGLVHYVLNRAILYDKYVLFNENKPLNVSLKEQEKKRRTKELKVSCNDYVQITRFYK